MEGKSNLCGIASLFERFTARTLRKTRV